jgi:hypothetical protein
MKQTSAFNKVKDLASRGGVCALSVHLIQGHSVAQLVEELRYKLQGRRFDSRWCHWNFSGTMALGLTQPLTEMSTRNISWR